MAKIINNGKFVARDSNGDPLAGGKLYSYVSGSGGATQKATYTTSALTVANTNPVILDGDGRADVWTAGGSYLLVLKDSADNTIWTVDDYNDGTNEDVNSAYDTYGIFTVTVDGTTTINVNTVLGVDYELGVNALRVYVNGVHQELADGAFAEVTGGQTIEMAEGLNVGDVVGIYLRSTVASAITQASLVTYIPPDVGDIQTNVRDALRALDVTNIAELKAIDGSYASKAIVNGYYTDGDGGGGEFYWDPTSSATADDGITIQPTSVTGNGRWIRIYSGAVNVKWFGAKGDGVINDSTAVVTGTDDTLAFASAIATTSTVYIPSGNYRISTGKLSVNSGQIITGSGENTVLLSEAYSPDTAVNYTTYAHFNEDHYLFILEDCQHSEISNMKIFCANQVGDNGGRRAILIKSSGSADSYFNRINNIDFRGGNPASDWAGATANAVRGHCIGMKGASIGRANYWNIIENCRIQGFHTSIYAEGNANAANLVNVQFWDTWLCLAGGFQQWTARNLFWHSSTGDAGMNALFIFLTTTTTPDGTHLAGNYNDIWVHAEPGSSYTSMYIYDGVVNGKSPTTNILSGLWQVTSRGTDYSGNRNVFIDHIAQSYDYDGGVIVSSKLSKTTIINDDDTTSTDETTINIFGDGTSAQAGNFQQKVKIFGGNGETRHGTLHQTIGGPFIIEDSGGDIEIRQISSGGGIRIDASATAQQTRLLVYDVDNGQLERVSVGAADSGGTGYKVLRIPN